MQKENTKSVLITLLLMLMSSLIFTACLFSAQKDKSAQTERFDNDSLGGGIAAGYPQYIDELSKRGIIHIHCEWVNALHRCNVYLKKGNQVKVFDKGPVFAKYREVSINTSPFDVSLKLANPPTGPIIPYMRHFAVGLDELLKKYDSQKDKRGGGAVMKVAYFELKTDIISD